MQLNRIQLQNISALEGHLQAIQGTHGQLIKTIHEGEQHGRRKMKMARS
jgi:hypothetical protein